MKTERAKFIDNRGFSLVELIIIIAVMAILVAIAVPTFAHLVTRANEAADIAFMSELEQAVVLAHADREMGEITGVTVYVSTTDCSVIEIKYTEYQPTTQLSVERPVNSKNEKLLTEIMDLDYKFKALDSVAQNPDWNDKWEIELVTPTNPLDPFDPSEY